MPQKIKPLAFTAQEIDDLTDQWSDLEIAFRYQLAYSAVRKARITHGVKTFTQKTGLVKIGLTGELRKKGSVRGAVRDDGLVEDYFARIDSPEKAYWLGLLMAMVGSRSEEAYPRKLGSRSKQMTLTCWRNSNVPSVTQDGLSTKSTEGLSSMTAAAL